MLCSNHNTIAPVSIHGAGSSLPHALELKIYACGGRVCLFVCFFVKGLLARRRCFLECVSILG